MMSPSALFAMAWLKALQVSAGKSSGLRAQLASATAQTVSAARKGQLSGVSSGAKQVAGLLFLLIIVAILLPVAWGIMQTSGDVTIANETFNITDVPGGSLLQEPVFILVVLALMIVIVVKALDLV